ncbi:ribonuclease J [Pseudoneobacillus rhizosphaerae]|uniref:Ribonuclease J n=1 Tax=Pseudoneobacillus rhizosphaerae TaxID=2880968 RepID=A0A9C7L9V0_9BACI|nr:ribonuclease J [Pseudoneobacillus rhizosphaerae]CAG9607392.1 Ribonuclease J2 [Pseudoneobacillus rhizosphaerae]
MVIRKNGSIKLVALGGVGEFGKNMYVAEVDDDIFVIDAGLMFPENEMFGIDIVIPDITYLAENKHRVKAIFLTHGHEDHIGALSYLLRRVDVPVYGTKLTLALAKAKFSDQDFFENVYMEEIDSNTKLQFGSVEVSFFQTNHSIPDSVGISIHTSQGAIVFTGDFKFDQAATKLYKPEIGKMAQVGEKGVLCLLSDSTEADRPGYTVSEAIVKKELLDAFNNAKGRVIAACFSSDIYRIQHIFDIAYEYNRKVVVAGKSLRRIYDIAVNLGYLEIQEDVIIPFSDINQFEDEEVIVLVTGGQGDLFEVLEKMAKQIHKQINFKKGDLVLFAGSPPRGSEVALYKIIDMLYRAGANVISSKHTIQASSHGSQEELKFMINLMQPKFFIPIHGEYRMLKAHAKLAKSMGIPSDNIIIPEKGEVIEINEEEIFYHGKVPSGNVLIDGIGVGDVGNIVLRDRKLFSQDGVLVIVVTIKKSEKRLVGDPELITRGFVYVRESEKLIKDSNTLVKETVDKYLLKESIDWGGIKQEIREKLNQFLFEKTKRKPMIIPILIEV